MIYVSHRQYESLPLFAAANRDEFYKRSAKEAHFWDESDRKDKGILGGKDLQAGGTWFAVDRSGRWGAVTNYRDPKRKEALRPRSRGLLISDYLFSQESPKRYVRNLSKSEYPYKGFSILCGDGEELYYYSNVEKKIKELSPGLYALSNHLLDTPWPKAADGKEILRTILSAAKPPPPLPLIESVLSFLQNSAQAPKERLPHTGVDLEWEKILSARFIISPEYGTRASSIFWIDKKKEAYFTEQSYGSGGRRQGRQEFRFSIGN